jgi:beta-glucosidase
VRLRCALAVATFAVLAALPAQASAQDRPWLDPGPPPDERARLVLGEMTLEEKVSLMHGSGAKTVDGESFQVHVRGIERLGIPEQTFADGATGIRGGTQLPAPIALLPSRLPNRAALAREKDAANAFARGRLLS